MRECSGTRGCSQEAGADLNVVRPQEACRETCLSLPIPGSKWEERCRGVRGWAAEGIGVPECLSVPVFLALAQMGT